MLSENELNFSDQYETLPDQISRCQSSSTDHISSNNNNNINRDKLNLLPQTPRPVRDCSMRTVESGNQRKSKRKSYHLKKGRCKTASPTQPYYHKTMSWISESSFKSSINRSSQVYSPVSCCSSPYRSNNDISFTSLHYQETRDVLLSKNTFDKYGIKINKIAEGFYISLIVSDSPAAKAGLKVGDEIIRINNESVDRFSNYKLLEVIKASENELKISFKPRLVIARLRLVILKKVNGKFGIRVQRRSEGIYVAIVIPNSSASNAGIREGDEILKINDDIVSSWSQEEVTNLLRDINTDDAEILIYIRQIKPVEDLRIIHHMQNCRQNCLGIQRSINDSFSISPYEF